MIEILLNIFTADLFSYIIVGLLTFWAGGLIKAMTGSSALSWSFMPVIAFGALAAIDFFQFEGIALVADKDSNVIIVSCIGMLAGLIVMLLVTKLVYMALDLKKPVTKSDAVQHGAPLARG